MNAEDSKACRSAPSDLQQMFHLEIFSQFLNLHNFRVKFFAPIKGKVALANENYLIISDGVATDKESGADRSSASDINTLIEFNELAGKPTVLLWISDHKICVGYDTGNLACFDVNGDIIFEQKLSGSSVQAMQISDDDSSSGGNLWIMHSKGHLVTVPIESIIDGTGNHSSSFQLVENVTDVSDFVVLPFVYSPGIFSLEGLSDAAHSLLVAADSDASLSMYNIGGKQQFQHLGKLGSYLKNQVSSAISKTFQSIFTMGAASSSAEKGNRIKPAASVALASLIDFEDPKRKVLRMKLDPSGELVAAADNLGRVTLYDIRLNVIVRLWKGVRDARLAFSSRETDSKVHISLAIYAPQLGLLSFYAMKHGPCLRIVPIPCGSQCQIYTTVERSSGSNCRTARCWLARGVDGSDGGSAESSNLRDDADFKLPRRDSESSAVLMKITVTVMDPYSQDPDDLDPGPIPSQPLSQLNAGASSADLQLGDSDPGSQQGSVPPSLPLSLGAERGKDSDSEVDSPPPVPTARQVDAILRGFKAALSDFAVTYSSAKRPSTSVQLPVRLEDAAAQRKKSEDALLAVMSSLLSVDALLECAVCVDSAELTGDVAWNANKSTSGKCKGEVRAAPLFSTTFHSSLHRLIKAMALKSQMVNADAGAPSLHALEQDMACRDRLLEAYSSFSSKYRDRDLFETATAGAALQCSEDGLLELSRGNSSRAEAAYAICNAQKRCDRAVNMAKLAEQPRTISFSLYRCLHSLSEWRARETAESPSMLPLLGRVITLGSTLETSKDRVIEIEIDDISQLISGSGGGKRTSAAQSLRVPASVCSAVACFLVSPLFAGDVFGLLCYSSALGLSGFTPSSCLQHILPCAVLRLETCWEEASTILLMDVSSSPLQRWLRDTLLNLYDNYVSLSSELSSEDSGSSEGFHTDSDAVTKSATKSKTSLKARQSMISLEDAMREMIARDHPKVDLTDQSQSQGQGLPTFDNCVRHLLRETWSLVRQSGSMEAMLAFVGVVNETLLTVSEQIMRKSYGTSSLGGTVCLWENLFQQLRVSIILSGHLDLIQEKKFASCVRGFDTKFFPAHEDRVMIRNCSVYRVLALDSLSFDVRVDHSVEHERQCRAVYDKRLQQIEAGAVSGTHREGDSAPTAWGASTDSSWRELLPLPLPGDEPTDRPKGKSKPNAKKRTRRPLLLYFPLHNQPSILGAYRAMELSTRWTRHPHRIELLRAVGEHLLSLSAVTRGAIAEAVFEESLLPLLRRLIALRTREQLIEGSMDITELSVALSDVSSADVFIKAVMELLSFVLKASSEVQLLMPQSDVSVFAKADPLQTRPSSTEGGQEQELGEVCEQLSAWPSVEDPFLTSLVVAFHSKGGCYLPTLRVHEAALRVLQLKYALALGTATLPGAASEVKERERADPFDFSRLFGVSEQKVLSRPRFPSKRDIDIPLETATDPRVSTARYEFMRCCFQRIALAGGKEERADLSVTVGVSHAPALSQERITATSVSPPNPRPEVEVATGAATVCYILADLWGLNIQQLRMAHLAALLNADCNLSRKDATVFGCVTALEMSCSRDMEIERLLPLISDSAMVVTLLISTLRRRIGMAVGRMEGLPHYGPLLASTDSDAIAWCLDWSAGAGAGAGAGAKHAMGSTDINSSDHMDDCRVSAVSIASGTADHSLNLVSTRNLTARALILLDVAAAAVDKNQLKALSAQCEALLTLCDMLSKA